MNRWSRQVVMPGLALALLVGAPAHAQSKKELVNRLLILQQPGVEAMARQIGEQPAVQLAVAARQAFGNVPQDKREAVAKAIDADLKKYTDEAVPLLRERAIKLMPATIGTELETNFSDAELKQLIEWFESPVTKRFNAMAPQMQRAMTDKLVNDTRAQIEPKLKTLEQSMAKHLGLPPPTDPPAAPSGGPGVRGGDTKK
jgi:hypothetical protein